MSQIWSHLPCWFLRCFLRLGRQTGWCSQQPASCRRPCAASSVFPPLVPLRRAKAVASAARRHLWQQVGVSGTDKTQRYYTGNYICIKGTPVKQAGRVPADRTLKTQSETVCGGGTSTSAQTSETSSASPGWMTNPTACASRQPPRTRQSTNNLYGYSYSRENFHNMHCSGVEWVPEELCCAQGVI